VEAITRTLSDGGWVLLQSNVEAVAQAMEVQFRQQGCYSNTAAPLEDFLALTHRKGETEAACLRSGRAVHRVLLQIAR